MREKERISKIDLEGVKHIQVEILSAIDEFCQKQKIKYSLACGSLLGAIRHNGYIPWDDDIDIYLEREDYNRLVNEFPSTYKKRYQIISLENHHKWNRPYAKAYDNRTVFKEKTTSPINIGINIDIYPVDKVPNDISQWERYNKKRRFFQNLFSAKFIAYSHNRALYKNFILAITKFIVCPISTRTFATFLSLYSQKYNHIESDFLFENVQGMLQKRPFKRADFHNTVSHLFENKEFKIMKGYDDYLKNAYGNYMQLPPPEKQITHHNFEAFWKQD